MAETPVSRIDMKHGFMKSIIRNQVDRNTYDKEVRAKKGMSKTAKHSGSRHKKPEASVYIPPMRQQKDENVKEEMFCLEFEDKNGEVYNFTIYKCDKAGAVARRIGQEAHLPPLFVVALEERLQQEFEKHASQNNQIS
ncbi:UPF0561 protein C2orf68 homolog [Ylistrum balloti]|uniref:UPF0561 protein C2orf68 homolog n=1 Tax=Ylistrum balloti TaxID=509963 RepID=UPI002905D0DA|nr:UPF0561 protein C2orf68 homolog [Ylistrum balloti]